MFLSNSFVCFFIFNHINQLIKYICPLWNQPKRQIILSTSHAVYTSILSSLYLTNVITEFLYYHLVSISFGFVLYDIGQIIIIRNHVWKQMLFHHIMILFGLFPYVYYSFTNILPFSLYPYFIAMNYLVEFATIPLNISWYLNNTGNTDGLLFKITSITTLILYIPFRVINTGYLAGYVLLYLPRVLPLQEIQVIFFILNIFWFYKLCKKAISFKNRKKD